MHLGSKISQSQPSSSCRDTQNLVTQSYIQAQSSNAVSFTQIPQEVTVNNLGVSRWDPFELPTHQFKRAQLDEEKLEKMRMLIRSAIPKLPMARDWTRFAEKHNLDAQSIDCLIVDAFCSNAGTVANPVEATTTELGCGVLARSQYLWPKNTPAAKLAKLIGCAIMCVSEYIDGGFKHSAGILNKKMASALTEVPGVQRGPETSHDIFAG